MFFKKYNINLINEQSSIFYTQKLVKQSNVMIELINNQTYDFFSLVLLFYIIFLYKQKI